jgi:hypothetical protein
MKNDIEHIRERIYQGKLEDASTGLAWAIFHAAAYLGPDEAVEFARLVIPALYAAREAGYSQHNDAGPAMVTAILGAVERQAGLEAEYEAEIEMARIRACKTQLEK